MHLGQYNIVHITAVCISRVAEVVLINTGRLFNGGNNIITLA